MALHWGQNSQVWCVQKISLVFASVIGFLKDILFLGASQPQVFCVL